MYQPGQTVQFSAGTTGFQFYGVDSGGNTIVLPAPSGFFIPVTFASSGSFDGILTESTETPTVTISAAGVLTSQANQTISGTVTDTTAAVGATVTLYDNADTTPIGTATVGVGGAWTTTMTLSGDGIHS
jgi:hypothetical protein